MTLRRCAALVAVTGLTLPAAAAAHGVHAGAAPAGAAPAPARLRLVLPLVTDVHGLTRFASAVSTPGSPLYGRYATVPWLARHFGASAALSGRVLAYLRAHGARDARVDATGQFVEARMSRTAAQRLFARGRVPAVRAPRAPAAAGPVVPRALRGLVTGVLGLDPASPASDSPAPSAAVSPPPSSGYQGPDPGATPSGCAAGTAEGGFTPNEYLDAYGYTPLQQQGLTGQGESVAVIEIDGFKPSDLRTFARCFHLRVPRIQTIPVALSHALPAGGEATLDLEVLEAAAPDLRTIDVYETGSGAADVLTALSQPLEQSGFKPQVISVSLGLCESNTLAGVSRAGVRAMESVLKVAAAAGVSVLGASGDFGSADCATSTLPPAPVPRLAVNFPSSSPWVTSVGGTNLDLDSQNQIVDQTVWNDAGVDPGNASGGGSSMLFSRPSWQDGVVAGPWRAQPDVAMLADVSPGYAVYCTTALDCHGRGWVSFGGTSAATPLLAGGFALVDQLLRRHGRVALGLANPLLYRLGRNPVTAAQVFFDVTTGSNDVGPFIQQSQQPLGCCDAKPGYDEASGWGGVDLDALAQSALQSQRGLAEISLRLPAAQHPVSSDGIYVLVRCSAGCEAAAYARFSARGMRSFSDRVLARLPGRGTRRLEVVFTPVQLLRVQAALRAHRRVAVSVAAAVVDATGNIERRTPNLRMQFSG